MSRFSARIPVFAGTVLVGGLTGWSLLVGWSIPVQFFLLMATVVSAVGTSEAVADVAGWYYVLQSAILGLFGVGLMLMGHDTPLVVGLTGTFVVAGLLFAVRYRQRRRATPYDEKVP